MTDRDAGTRDAAAAQDVAESLDDDKLGREYPPEEPLAVEDYGVTPRQDAVEEPIEERVARREEPDERPPVRPAEPGVGRLVEPDAGGAPDAEADAVAEAAEGRAQADPGRTAPATERAPDLSAEEEAVHETAPPPLGDEVPPRGTGDGYVDDAR